MLHKVCNIRNIYLANIRITFSRSHRCNKNKFTLTNTNFIIPVWKDTHVQSIVDVLATFTNTTNLSIKDLCSNKEYETYLPGGSILETFKFLKSILYRCSFVTFHDSPSKGRQDN